LQLGDEDLGLIAQIKADAQGVPGQRKFRLLVEAQRGSACLWLEKEQLLQLGIAIKRLIAEMSQEEPSIPLENLSTQYSDNSDIEISERDRDLTVDTITLGHDQGQDLFLLAVQGADTDDERLQGVRFWAEGQQLDALADEAFEVCASGRPLCPLCGVPINSNEDHVCSRSNGHHDSVDFD
jgi:uncharacterized repeat protein (TIGR03847 family)